VLTVGSPAVTRLERLGVQFTSLPSWKNCAAADPPSTSTPERAGVIAVSDPTAIEPGHGLGDYKRPDSAIGVRPAARERDESRRQPFARNDAPE
jgi:hypothetical protein